MVRCPACHRPHSVYRVVTEKVILPKPRRDRDGNLVTHQEVARLVPTFAMTRGERFCEDCRPLFNVSREGKGGPGAIAPMRRKTRRNSLGPTPHVGLANANGTKFRPIIPKLNTRKLYQYRRELREALVA